MLPYPPSMRQSYHENTAPFDRFWWVNRVCVDDASRMIQSNPHLRQDFFLRNRHTFFTQLFPWEEAFSELTELCCTMLKKASSKRLRDIGWDYFKNLQAHGESRAKSILLSDIRRRDTMSDLFQAFRGLYDVRDDPSASQADKIPKEMVVLLKNVFGFEAENDRVQKYGDIPFFLDRLPFRMDVFLSRSVRENEIPRVLCIGFPRVMYRRRQHELKTVIHWGQRKLLMSEIEFLNDYGMIHQLREKKKGLVVYAGAAPGTHITFLSEIFPEMDFVLVDPCDFSSVLDNFPQIHVLHRTYFSLPMARFFHKDVKHESPEASKFLNDIEMSYRKEEEQMHKTMCDRIPIISAGLLRLDAGLLEDLGEIRERISIQHKAVKAAALEICESEKIEMLSAFLDLFVMDGNLDEESPKQTPHAGSLSLLTSLARIREKDGIEEELTNRGTKKIDTVREWNNGNLLRLRRVKEKYSGEQAFFVCDVRTADFRRMKEEEHEEYVEQDMKNQQKWVQSMCPLESLLKFRLPYSGGTVDYMDGKVYLPVWGPPTTTESRFVPVPSDGSKIVAWDATKYEQQMFAFNIQLRTMHFEHTVGYPYDHCFDCASEIHILSSYLRFHEGITDAEEINLRIRYFCKKIDKLITSHGKRTIMTLQKKKGFKATEHTTDLDEVVAHDPYLKVGTKHENLQKTDAVQTDGVVDTVEKKIDANVDTNVDANVGADVDGSRKRERDDDRHHGRRHHGRHHHHHHHHHHRRPHEDHERDYHERYEHPHKKKKE